MEKISTNEIKLWTYRHTSSGEGILVSYVFSPEGIKKETLTINPGDSGTEMGNAIYKSVFNDKHLIKMEEVKNYIVPANPSGLQWGK
jgi:hypothetical protein